MPAICGGVRRGARRGVKNHPAARSSATAGATAASTFSPSRTILSCADRAPTAALLLGSLPPRFSVKQVVVETALATKAPSLVPGPGKRPLANRVLANCTSTRSFVRTNASRVPHLGPLLWHLHHLLLSCWMLC